MNILTNANNAKTKEEHFVIDFLHNRDLLEKALIWSALKLISLPSFRDYKVFVENHLQKTPGEVNERDLLLLFIIVWHN